jgi:hypothetical protein
MLQPQERHRQPANPCRTGGAANRPAGANGIWARRRSDRRITTIGLDIAKNVFQLHGIDAAEKVVVRKQLRRSQVLAFFKALPESTSMAMVVTTGIISCSNCSRFVGNVPAIMVRRIRWPRSGPRRSRPYSGPRGKRRPAPRPVPPNRSAETRSPASPAAARAPTGHAAAPPRSVMNARLFIQSPRRRWRAAMAARSGRAPWRFGGL